MALVLIVERGKVVAEGEVVITAVSVEMAAYGGKPCAFLCQGVAERSVGDEAVSPAILEAIVTDISQCVYIFNILLIDENYIYLFFKS